MKNIVRICAIVAVMVAVAGTASATTLLVGDMNAWATHGGGIVVNGDGSVTATTGNDPDYHWNKSGWAGRTGQKAFLTTGALNGLKVGDITEFSWDFVSGYWGNAYFNIMVEDVNGFRAILAPSSNSAASTGFNAAGLAFAVFEAEVGWTGTAATGFNAATWDQVKDLTISPGPFTEFPDTLTGDATAQNDAVYQESNWGDWAGLWGNSDWADHGVLVTFGQSTGTATPETVINNFKLSYNQPIPEPATISLLLLGVGGLVARNRRKQA